MDTMRWHSMVGYVVGLVVGWLADVYASLFRVYYRQLIQIGGMSKYEGRVDPLELLRAAYAAGKPPKLKERHLVFQKDLRLPLTFSTAWVGTQTRKQYTLGSIWLYLQYRTGNIFDYIERISDYALDNVVVSDRKEIEQYFLSKDSKTTCISQQLRQQSSSKNSKVRDQPSTALESVSEPSKRVKTEALSAELQVIDFINKFERPISSKSRSLRCTSKSFEPLLKVLQASEPAKVEEKKLRISKFEGRRFPIIIVPDRHNPGNISLANIEKFLINGEYIANPPPLPQHQRKIELILTLKGKKLTFEVCNNPKLMLPNDWPSVVAVFVQGRTNEFEGWPCTDPALIFKQAKGFRLSFSSKEESAAWVDGSIKEVMLDRNMRYRDAGIQREIMGEIEAHLFSSCD